MAFLAALPVALTAASAATTAAAGLAAFAGQRQQANYEQSAYNQQAQFQTELAKRNEQIVATEGRAAEDALRRDRMRRLGLSRARAGASGTTLEGSPLEALADEASQYGRDLNYLQYQTRVRMQDARLGGQVATRRELLNATAAGIAGDQAFGSILGGFGQAGAIAAGIYA